MNSRMHFGENFCPLFILFTLNYANSPCNISKDRFIDFLVHITYRLSFLFQSRENQENQTRHKNILLYLLYSKQVLGKAKHDQIKFVSELKK